MNDINGNRTVEYSAWLNIRDRCRNSNNKQYKDYGGRGIKMCTRWEESYETFLKDMGRRPEHLVIDRIDNNGHYEPDNCHWTTKAANNRNSKQSKWWIVYGIRYDSAPIAAEALNTCTSNIKRWCKGYRANGKYYPALQSCYTEPKYKES